MYARPCIYSSSPSADDDRRFLGIGHTKSWTSAGQNSRILSWRYHCLRSESPSGGTIDGTFDGCGRHVLSLRRTIFFSLDGGVSLALRTNTAPGELEQNLKWPIFLIPANAVLTVCSAKNSAQSYAGTNTSPRWFPTSWQWFILAEFLTTSAISWRQPTFVRRNWRLSMPKPASGKNFVWPTGKNEMVISLCCFVRTRHMR